jgi:peptidyl-prolyl cis-trans isomerase SurA
MHTAPTFSPLTPHRPKAWMPIIGAILLAAALGGCSDIPNPFKPAVVVPAATGPTTVQTGKIGGGDSIPVVVDDRPITHYDIDQRVRLMQISGAPGGEKQATSDLVDETLEMEEASKAGVSIPAAQVDAAYASVASNLKLSSAGLTQALSGEGIDGNTLKRRLLAQITWQQLVVTRAQTTNQVKESDVTNALLAKGDPQSLTTKEYTLQQIVFVVPSGSPSSAFDQRRREAESFRQRFQSCDNSIAQAKLLNGVVVKDLGRHDSTDLGGGEIAALKSVKAGGTLAPDQISQGIEVIAVCDVKDIQSTDQARADIENQIFQKQSDSISKDYLKALHAQATIVYQ